jgi:hypothetical protein
MPITMNVVISVLALAVSILSMIFARRDKDADARKKALDTLENNFRERVSQLDYTGNARYMETSSAMSGIENRLSRLEESVKQIPTHRDIDVLQNAIGLLGQSVAKLEGSVEQNIQSVGRITNFLLERSS